jgi:large subunit ribosomal protein L9
MKVILLNDVPKLGTSGQEVTVAPGYARNFLFPKKLAIHVTIGTQKQAEQLKNRRSKKEVAQAKELYQLLDAIPDRVTRFEEKAADNGTLFAAINAEIIAQRFGERGMSIKAEHVQMVKPIKKVGEHILSIMLPEHKPVEWKIIVEKISQ